MWSGIADIVDGDYYAFIGQVYPVLVADDGTMGLERMDGLSHFNKMLSYFIFGGR